MTAWRARQVNQRISKTAHIKELNTEIGRLKAELHATREKNGVYIPLEHFHQQEQVRFWVLGCRLRGRVYLAQLAYHCRKTLYLCLGTCYVCCI